MMTITSRWKDIETSVMNHLGLNCKQDLNRKHGKPCIWGSLVCWSYHQETYPKYIGSTITSRWANRETVLDTSVNVTVTVRLCFEITLAWMFCICLKAHDSKHSRKSPGGEIKQWGLLQHLWHTQVLIYFLI